MNNDDFKEAEALLKKKNRQIKRPAGSIYLISIITAP